MCERADRPWATYSTMARLRASGASQAFDATSGLPDPTGSRFAAQEHVRSAPAYARWTQVDDAGLQQMLELFGGSAPPALTWWNTTVTDAAHHAGGPRSPIATASLVDSDRRLGAFLDLLDRRGLSDDTVLLLTADHGFEAADPDCRGDWGPALLAAGLSVIDEGPGMLYLGSDR